MLMEAFRGDPAGTGGALQERRGAVCGTACPGHFRLLFGTWRGAPTGRQRRRALRKHQRRGGGGAENDARATGPERQLKKPAVAAEAEAATARGAEAAGSSQRGRRVQCCSAAGLRASAAVSVGPAAAAAALLPVAGERPRHSPAEGCIRGRLLSGMRSGNCRSAQLRLRGQALAGRKGHRSVLSRQRKRSMRGTALAPIVLPGAWCL